MTTQKATAPLPSTTAASIGLSPALRDRLYAAARAQGYPIMLGPNSRLQQFVEHMVSLAEAEAAAAAHPGQPARAAAAAVLMQYGSGEESMEFSELAQVIARAWTLAEQLPDQPPPAREA